MSSQNIPDFDSFWNYSRPEHTEKKFRETLLHVPDNHPAFLELLTQIARAQGLQNKFEKAHHTLDQVETRLSREPTRAKIRYLLERGRVFNSSGHPEESRSFFEQALELGTHLGEDFYAVDAVHMLAIVSPPDQSLTLNLQAIQMAESSEQEKANNWLGSLYNNLGWSYHDLGQYESALEIFEKGETWQASKGRVSERRIATWTVARTLRSLNRVEEALAKQLALKEEFATTEESDGYVFEEIAECLLLLNRQQEAVPYFEKAYNELSEDIHLVQHEPERLERLKQLGGI